MVKGRAFFGIFLGLCNAVQGAEWTKTASANFELYTTAGAGDAGHTLESFEQVRDFFMRVKSSNVTTRLPVTIVGFRNLKEYKPYTASEASAAYYTGDEQRDYIVMSQLGPDDTSVAIHEYMHLLIRHSGLKMPIWLNEGFAEVYSTLKPYRSEVLLGTPPMGRALSLSRDKWIPLARLVSVEHDAPEYNERDRAGIFYSQSWLLTHMLMLSDEYKEKFSSFVSQLSANGSTEAAFSAVYGRTMPQVEKDFQAYYRSNHLKGVLFKTGFNKVKIDPGVPAPGLDVDLTLAKLTALLGRYEEALSRLNQLSSSQPDNYQVEEALAHLFWRKSDLEAARQHFGKAIATGAKSWHTYWDYSRLLASDPGNEQKCIDMLRKTVGLQPGLTEARLLLGERLYSARLYAQALISLRGLKQVEPEQAASIFLVMAYSAAQVAQPEEARRYAEQARKYARTADHSASAEQLLRYLNRPEPSQNLPAINAVGTKHLTAKGRLKQLDCLETTARVHVYTGSTTVTLLIRDPNRVILRNSGGGGTVNMTCGLQDTPIAIDYVPVADPESKTSGEVQAIEFLQ